MAHTAEVVFALERFEWAADDRLEVVGRWEGLDDRRKGRATLSVVEAGGRRRRLHALPGGPEPGEQPWRAEFAWDGNGAGLAGAELELGRLVVELPPPRRRRRRSTESQHTPPPLEDRRMEELELRLGEAQAELVELRDRLDDEADARRALEHELADSQQRLAAHDENAATLDAERAEVGRSVDAERADLERLREEVRRLRDELEARPAPALAPTPRRHAVEAQRAHPGTAAELWGARIAAAVLAGLLLLALALIVATFA
jgi:hypothetical protein